MSAMDFGATLIATGFGAAIGFAGTSVVSWQDRRTAKKAERRRLLARYLAAASLAVGQLRDVPNAELGVIRQAVDEIRGEAATYSANQKALRETLGERWFEPLHELIRAGADLEAVSLSPDARASVDACTRYIERLAQERTSETRAEWPTIHGGLISAIRAVG
jgi:hypothetical protein